MNTIVVYGSSTGNTKQAAEKIADNLGADLEEVNKEVLGRLNNYGLILLGSSTWGCGDLQDDWDSVADSLAALDLSGKKVALFGLGDQSGYTDTFVDAIGILYEKLSASGSEFIGKWPVEGYDFEASRAQKGDSFYGLVLDEDNQSSKSAARIDKWTAQLKQESAEQ